MLENEIIPLYFEKNSKGYSPRWIQYIKGSIGDIAPHFTMKRMIDDYISRFYDKEAKRSADLGKNGFALAKEIVEWKEKVAAEWDGIKVLDFQASNLGNTTTGAEHVSTAVVDSNGIGADLRLELVVYKNEDNQDKFIRTVPFELTKQDGNINTYSLKGVIKDPGVFRYGYRLYPYNPALPHRQDFAYTRWI